VLKADDLCPEPVAFGRELDDPVGHRSGGMLPAQRFSS
jgi:hypothetical protein